MNIIILIGHHSRGFYTVPYDSTSGMPVIFGPISIAIVLYFVVRVWWEFEKDKRKTDSKKEEDAENKKSF